MHDKESCPITPAVSVTSDPQNYNPALNKETTLTQTIDPQSKMCTQLYAKVQKVSSCPKYTNRTPLAK
jgi:hypothetical protein